MWRGLLLGVCLWLAALVIFKLAPIPQVSLLWAGIIGLAIPVGSLLFGLAKPLQFWQKQPSASLPKPLFHLAKLLSLG